MNAPRITRRHVLAATAGLAAASAVGAGSIGTMWWNRPPGDGLLVLSDTEHAFAHAIAEAWFPPGGVPPISGGEAKLADFLDAIVSHMHPGTAKEMKLLLHAMDALPLPTHRGHFTSLDVDTRSEILRAWLTNDNHLIRSAASGVMVLLGVGWTTHPEVAPILNPWFGCSYGR